MLRAAIAEDDFRVAAVHEQFLTKVTGIELVGKALNARETMDLLRNHSIDLLLLDIYMPDELGTDLLPAIREEFPKVDIIMITASTDKSLLEKSVRNGVVHYLIKPITLDQFIETIEEYKSRRKLLTTQNQVDQTLVDHYLGIKNSKTPQKTDLPKGIDPLTLTKVNDIITEARNGLTAEEVGVSMGASRTTARRYLEYLISVGDAKAELEYGIVGRPERRYRVPD
ncbi:MAG TPA: response regulator [Bacillales bacterium]|nr:response regulator [Bacillales bacterium]